MMLKLISWKLTRKNTEYCVLCMTGNLKYSEFEKINKKGRKYDIV